MKPAKESTGFHNHEELLDVKNDIWGIALSEALHDTVTESIPFLRILRSVMLPMLYLISLVTILLAFQQGEVIGPFRSLGSA